VLVPLPALPQESAKIKRSRKNTVVPSSLKHLIVNSCLSIGPKMGHRPLWNRDHPHYAQA
jgi:hypothetical protein